MARGRTWIAMAIAIPLGVPATVAFSPVRPPGAPPWEPPPLPPTQPVAAITPKAAAPAAPAPAPAALPPPSAVPPTPDRDAGAIVVDAALTRLGAPYEWAATGPDAFDCSGLIVWAFRQAGITLPHSSVALASGGQPVEPDQMQPGDVIILFPDASHAGMYIGDGRMIHAQFEGQPVVVESLHLAPIHSVRRYR